MSSLFSSRLSPFSVLLLVIGLAACAAPPSPTNPPISSNTSIPLPSITPSPTRLPAETPPPTGALNSSATPNLIIAPTLSPLEPLVTAPFIYFAGWSPDSRMLAYWTYTQEEVDSLPHENLAGYPPGVLHFYDTTSGTTCDYPFPAHYSFLLPTFAWQADGRAIVRGDDGVIRLNTSCQDDFSTMTGTEAEMLLGNPEFSPSGLYQAHSEIDTDYENGIVTYHLTITDLANGQIVNTLDWQVPLALGVYTSPGGEWIRDDLFLVSGSLERGPILIRVGDEPQYVIPEFFNLPVSCLEQYCDHSVFASARTDLFTGNFHIALWAFGLENAQANVLLYHSEDGKVETVPFQFLRWPFFSPDGQWLLLEPNGNADEIWLQKVDPAGSQAVLFTETKTSSWTPTFSPNGLHLAYSTQNGLVETLTLADQSVLGTWSLAPFEPRQITWPPNGTSLAVESASFTAGEQVYALFLIASSREGNLNDAQVVLTDFFRLLHESQYAQAIPFYGGTYEILQYWNPEVDPNDVLTFWQNACEFNGLRCLQVLNIASQTQISPTEFHFVVEFMLPDGSLFILGPCCGATEEEMPPVSQFEYTVILGLDGQYRVTGLPVYVP